MQPESTVTFSEVIPNGQYDDTERVVWLEPNAQSFTRHPESVAVGLVRRRPRQVDFRHPATFLDAVVEPVAGYGLVGVVPAPPFTSPLAPRAASAAG
jgi:hypothetical protein